MSTLKVIHSPKAPQAIGCYSQAIQAGQMIFISGQIGLDPTTQNLVTGGFEAQLRQVFNNLNEVIVAAGINLAQIVKLTIYLKDLNHFPIVNDTMKEYFREPYPARATIQISDLPKGALVEIDAIAVI
ncbi:MAG: RidA family protein [Candidatus Berkiellales bacterium]